MIKRKTVEITEEVIDVPSDLSEFILYLEEKKKGGYTKVQLTEEYDRWDDRHYARLQFNGERPETDSELKARIDKEARIKAESKKAAKEKALKEKELYEKLKKKYEKQ